MKTNERITIAAIYAPGRAIFGECLLSLTANAWEAGVNLSEAEIRKACPAEGGGVWVSGECESKHYSLSGNIDN